MPVIRRDWGDFKSKINNDNIGDGFADKRMYKPKFSKDGTFAALIRFLPAPGNEMPLVKTYTHRFKIGRAHV